MGRSVGALAGMILLGACSRHATEIVVAVDSDLSVPNPLSAIDAHVMDMSGAVMVEQVFLLTGAAQGQLRLPLSFAVAPRSGHESLKVVIEVRGLDVKGGLLVARTAVTRFIVGRSLLLPMYLAGACASVACPKDQTCTELGCATDEIDPAMLVDFDPGHQFDRVRRDAGPARDGAVPEGGLDAALGANADASPDGGEDAMPDATDDGATDDGATGDGATDAASDAASDATPDGGADASPDASPDSGACGAPHARGHPAPTGNLVSIQTDPTHYGENPAVATDGSGNAIAAWSQFSLDGLHDQVWASRYSALTSTWDAPVRLDSDPGSSPGAVSLASNAAGQAVAAWAYQGTGSFIHAAIFDGVHWGATATVSVEGIGFRNAVAIDPRGNVLLAWRDRSGMVLSVYQQGTWSAPVVLHAMADSGDYPSVALNSHGDGIVAWVEASVAGNLVIWTSFYSHTSSAFGGTVRVDDSATDNAEYPRAALNDSGIAFVVWQRSTAAQAWANRYDALSGGWGTATEIDVPMSGPVHPQTAVAADACGGAIAVFAQASSGGSTIFSAMATRFTLPGAPWSPPVALGMPGMLDERQPSIAMTPDGFAFVIFSSTPNAGQTEIGFNSFVQGAWGPAERIGIGSSNLVSAASAITPLGDAIVVFESSANNIIDAQLFH